jgi:hypothetical protein
MTSRREMERQLRELHGPGAEIVEFEEDEPPMSRRYRIVRQERELFEEWPWWEKYPAAFLGLLLCFAALIGCAIVFYFSGLIMWAMFWPHD